MATHFCVHNEAARAARQRALARRSALRLGAATVAMAASAAQAQVVSGAAHTSVNTSGNQVTVTTSKVNGTSALAHMRQFDVASGTTATLVLPTGTSRLIGLIDSANQATVNGTVVSRLGSAAGNIGGHLLFAAPGGLLLGSTGKIYAGRVGIVSAKLSDTLSAVLDGDDLRADAHSRLLALDTDGGGSVLINGQIFAPDGVEIRARAITVGKAGLVAAGQAAADEFAARGHVGMGTLFPASRLVEKDGKITLVADSSVTLEAAGGGDPGGRVDARPLDSTDGLLAGGIQAEGRTISFGAGSQVDAWDGARPVQRGGDVTIRAEDSDYALGGITALGGMPDATASITLDGSIEGQSVDILAKAIATTESPDFDLPTLVLNNIIDILFDAIGFQVAVAKAEGNATLALGADSSIAARGGNLSLKAETETGAVADPLKLPVFINTTGRKFGFGFVYSQLDADASVAVGDRAALSATGSMTVEATNLAKNVASASSLARGENSFALAIGIGVSDIQSQVTVNSGATLDSGGAMTVKARNQAAFELDVSAKGIENGKAGGAVAIGYQDTGADVSMSGKIGQTTRPTTVDIRAENDVSKNTQGADVSIATGLIDQLAALPTDALFGKISETFNNVLGKRAQTTLPDDANPGKKASGAVSLLMGAHSATASVAPGAEVKSGGATTVDATMREGIRLDTAPNSGDGVVRNNATARTAATRKIDGVATTFTAALGITLTDLTAKATVGEAADVTAGRLAVGSNVERIYTENWTTEAPGADIDEIKDFALNLAEKAAVDLGLVEGFMTNSAGAIAGSEGASAISGSVAFSGVRGTSRAWVDSRAQLTLGDDLVVGGVTVPALSVAAASRLEGIQLAGPFSILAIAASGSDGGSAGGGSAGISLWDPNAIAGIGDGVVVRTPGSVAVNSDSDVRSIIIAPAAGSGGGVGFAGTVAVNIVEGDSRASISNAADIEAGGTVSVNADADLTLWSVAGSLALSAGSGQGETQGAVGIATAVNVGLVDTDARIGDNNDDDESAATQGRVSRTLGKIQTPGSVEVDAETTGQIGAIGVAGSYAGSSDGQPGILDKIKNTLKINQLTQFLSNTQTAITNKVANTFGQTKLGARDLGADSSAPDTQGPTSGFAAAGSATVTFTELATNAVVDGATIRHPVAGAAAGRLRVQAHNDLDLFSVTGGAAISKQSGDRVDSSKTLSGAFGVQFTTNSANAQVMDSLVSGRDAVEVGALTEGLRVAAGLSLSVDISKKGTDSTAAAGSISFSDVRDTALSEIADSDVVAPAADPGSHVSVSALNQITIGTGAGGVAVGGKNSAGASVAASEAAGWQGVKAAEAAVRRSSVRNFADMAIVARNESKLIGAALAVAASTNQDARAFVGSAVVHNVDMDALAELVVTDEAGGAAIQLSDQLVVQAGDAVADAPFVVPGQVEQTTNIGGGFASKYNVSASDLDLDADSPVSLGKSDFDAGSRVIGVAGGVGVAAGGSNSAAVGLAVAFNRIDNDNVARVTGSGAAPAIDVGRMGVRATDEAEILGIAAGLSVSTGQLAGMGSATINLVSGSAETELSTTAGSTGRLQVTARGGEGVQLASGATGDIWSFGGALAISTKGAAAGAAVAVNEIVRDNGETPGISAGATNVDITTGGTVAVSTTSDGAIKTAAGAVGVGKGVGLAGAAASNNIQSVSTAKLDGTNISALAGAAPSVSVTADDRSTIDSAAATLAAAFGGGGVGVSLAVNRISPTITALVNGGTITASGVAVDARSGAGIRTLAAGIGGGSEIGGAGSLAVNLIGTDVEARIRGGAAVTASDSVLVQGRQTNSVQLVSGALGIGVNVGGIGLSFTVNEIDGDTTAAIGEVGDATTTVTASGNGQAATVFDGELLYALPDDNAIESFVNFDLSQDTTDVRGIAVNASSGHSVLSFATSGGVGSYVGAGITTNVNLLGGNTTAKIEQAVANASGTGANSGSGVDVRASTNAIAATALLGVSGSGGFSLSTTMAGDSFGFGTTAKLNGAQVTAASAGRVNLLARGTQTAAQLSAGAAIGGGGVGIAASVVDTTSTVSARVEGGSTVAANTVAVNAENRIDVLSGALGVAAGGLGAGGALVLLFNESTAEAIVGDDTGGPGRRATVDADTVDVIATSNTNFDLYGAAGAVGAGFSLAGVGMVAIQTGTTRALVLDADIGGRGTAQASDVSVKATEVLDIGAYAGALSLDLAGAGVGLGVTVVSAQSDVLAEVVDSELRSSRFTLDADSQGTVDSLLLSAGIGGSIGVSAAVSLLQFGSGESGDFFSNEEIGGTGSENSSLSNLLDQADPGDAALAVAPLSAEEQARLADANSGSAGAGDAILRPAAHRVAASVRDTGTASVSLIEADSVAIGSGAAVRAVGRAPNVAAGAVAVAGTANIVRVYTNVEATTSAGTSITAGTVTIGAVADEQPRSATQTEPDGGALDLRYPTSPTRAAEGYSVLGSVGLVSGSVAYTDAKVAANVDARAGGTIIGTGSGTLSITAADRTEAGAQTLAVSASLMGVNGSVAVATKTSEVDASLGGSATGFRAVSVSANEQGRAEARAVSGSGGLTGTADAAVAVAANTATVNATILESARVGASGTLDVTATSQPIASAEALGVAVAGGVALGAAVANSNVSPTVQARIGEGADLTGAAALNVTARLNAPADASAAMARAKATAGTGGLLVGANGTSSRAITGANVRALVGTDLTGTASGAAVRLPAGDLTILAARNTRQSAEGLGVAVGALAAGAHYSEAESTGEAKAELGASDGTGRGNADASIRAENNDRNAAQTIAGSGGIVAGAAGIARTNSETDVTASFTAQNFTAGRFELIAENASMLAGGANAVNAAAVGASGGEATNRLRGTTSASVGAGAQLAANSIDILAKARPSLENGSDGYAAQGGSGGLLNGAGAAAYNDIDIETEAKIGNNARLVQRVAAGEDPYFNATGVRIGAGTELGGTQTVRLDAYGLIQVPLGKLQTDAVIANTVWMADGASINAHRGVGLGTWTTVSHAAQAVTKVYGGASYGEAEIDSNFDVMQDMRIAFGASITTLGDIRIAAGADADGSTQDRFSVGANSEVFNYTAVPLNTRADADIVTNLDNTVTLGSLVALKAGRDISISASEAGDAQTAKGVGRNPYLELFGTEETSGSASFDAVGTLSMTSATVEAGAFADRSLTFSGPAGAVAITSSGIDRSDPTALDYVAVDPFAEIDLTSAIDAQLAELAVAQANGDLTASAEIETLTEIRKSVRAGAIDSILTGPIFASAGNVNLDVGVLTATGSSLTARGKPTITVANDSERSLLLDRMFIPMKSGGSIVNAGRATLGSRPGLSVNEVNKDLQGEIAIRNGRLGEIGQPVSDVIVAGGLNNVGGAVDIKVANGSLVQLAPVEAGAYSADVPNGALIANQPDSDWAKDVPISLWYSRLGAGVALAGANAISPDTAIELAASRIGSNPAGRLQWSAASTPANWLREGYADNSSVIWLTGSGSRLYSDNAGLFSNAIGVTYPASSPLQNGTVYSRGIIFRPSNYTAGTGVAAAPSTSALSARTLLINARWVNLSGPIVVGTPNERSVTILSAADTYVAQQRVLRPNATEIAIPEFNGVVPLLQKQANSDRLVQVTYVIPPGQAAGYYAVRNVEASGGGFASITGRIVNTNHAGTGQITVLNGLGDVRLSNQTGNKLVVSDINAGQSPVGTVIINDTWKGVRSEFRHVRGEGITLTTNAFGSPTTTVQTIAGDSTTYAPNAGLRYRWTETRTYTRTTNIEDTAVGYLDKTASAWTAGPANPPSTGEFGAGPLFNFGQGNAAFAQQVRAPFSDSGWSVGGFVFNRGNSNEFVWDYYVPTSQTLTVESSVRADYPIGIRFEGRSTGRVQVSSIGNLELSGRITNPLGDTTITTGGVLTQSQGAAIETANLTLNAAGGIGLADRAFGARLTGSTVDISTQGDINLDLSNATDTFVRRLFASGDIRLESGGSVLRASDAQAVQVDGRNITILAPQGRIGTEAAPLVVQARATTDANGGVTNGVVTASARDGIALTQPNGDFRVGRIEATAGDVQLTAPTGAIVAATANGAVDPAELARLAGVWDALDIREGGPGDPNAIAINAIEGKFARDYADYQLLLAASDPSGSGIRITDPDVAQNLAIQARLSLQADVALIADIRANATVGPDGRITLTQAQADSFRSIAQGRLGRRANSSGALTIDEIRGAVQAYHDELATRVSAVLGTVPADPQAVTVGAPQLDAYATRRVAELRTGFEDLFGPDLPFDGTQPYVLDIQPGSSLYARFTTGSTWRDSWLDVVISKNALTPLANTQVLRTEPEVIGRNITLTAGRAIGATDVPLSFAITPGTTLTADQKAALIAAGPGDVQETDLGGGARQLTITRDRLLQVAAGSTVSATANGTLFLGAAGDLALSRLEATGAVRLVASEDILQTGTAGVVGGALRLEASGGAIGTAVQPLRVDVPRLELARAATDIYLTAPTDLNLGNLFAGSLARLVAPNGAIRSIFNADDVLHIQADRLEFSARGDIGSALAPLMSAAGPRGLSAVSALGGVAIGSPSQQLLLTDVSGTEVRLTGPAGFRIGGAVEATSNLTISGAGPLDVAATGQLEGRAILIGVGSLDAAVGSRIATAGLLEVETQGALVGRNLTGGQTMLRSGGALQVFGGAFATLDVGSGLALDLAAVSVAGSVDLRSGGGLTVGESDFGLLSATSVGGLGLSGVDVGGAATLSGGGDVGLADLQIGGDLSVTAGSGLGLSDAGVAGALVLRSGVALTVTNLALTGALDAQSGGDLLVTRVVGGAGAALVSGGALTGRDLRLAGALDATAAGHLQLERVVSGPARLVSGGRVDLTDGDIAGAVTVDGAGVALSGISADALTLTSAGEAQLADAAIAGAVTMQAAGDVAAERLSAGGNLGIRTGRALALRQSRAGGSGSLQSGAGMALSDVGFGGSLAAEAVLDLAVSDITAGITALSAGRDIELSGRIATGPFRADAGRNIRVAPRASVSAASPLTLASADALVLGGGSLLTATEAVTLEAAAVDGAADSQVAAGQALLVSARGAAQLGRLEAGTTADIRAGEALRLAGDLRAGGGLTIAAGGDLRLMPGVALEAASLSAQAGGFLDTSSAAISVFDRLTLAAAEGMRLGRLAAGGAADLRGRSLLLAEDVGLGSLNVDVEQGLLLSADVDVAGTVGLAAGGIAMAPGSDLGADRLHMVARIGDILLGRAELRAMSGEAARLTATGRILGNGSDGPNLKAAAAAEVLLAASGDVGAADGQLRVDAPEVMISSSNGSAWIRALSDVALTVNLPQGRLFLAADGGVDLSGETGDSELGIAGRLQIGDLSATRMQISARGGLAADLLTSRGPVSLWAPDIEVGTIRTAAAGSLSLNIAGFQGAGSAVRVRIGTVVAPDGLVLPVLAADDIAIGTLARSVQVLTGRVGNRLALETPDTALLFSRTAAVDPRFDVQLYDLLDSVALSLSGRTLVTATPVLVARPSLRTLDLDGNASLSIADQLDRLSIMTTREGDRLLAIKGPPASRADPSVFVAPDGAVNSEQPVPIAAAPGGGEGVKAGTALR